MNTELSKRLRLLASAVSLLVLGAVIAVLWIYARIRASLPQLDGTAPVPGLSAPVTVARDNLGVPTIRARSRLDVARALGFLHAQDRFFQMDVWRRTAAGELSEVFGSRTVDFDKKMRMHGFRRIAEQTLADLPPDQRAIVDAYADGVNAGLAALREKPWEYLVVRAKPQPWKPEDTFLVVDAMLIELQDDTGRYEKTLMSIRDQLGEPGLAFFAPLMTPADAALDGTKGPVAPIPGPDVLNLRLKAAAAAGRSRVSLAPTLPSAAATGVFPLKPAVDGAARNNPLSFLTREPDGLPGSNAFALAGQHTATGAALLASDIHLKLQVPNVWYRACFEYPGHKITGITLPGVPLMIAGSNGHVAWSFTNAYADTGDLIAFDVNPIAPSLYRAPGHKGLLEIQERHEVIKVAGHRPVHATYDWTIWGPIVGRESGGRPLAYLWTGHDPRATNLDLIGMEDAQDVAAAVRVAHRTGMPPQNIVIADSAGHIAWTIAGRLPRRVGYDGRLPVTFQFGDRSWNGYVPPDQIPVVTSEPTGAPDETVLHGGRIWSANQRMIGGPGLALIGDAGYGRPNRAAQIRDDLAHLEHATPRDLLAVQLDDRAIFMQPWHDLLLRTLTPQVMAQDPTRAKLRTYAAKWEGRAGINAIGYPIARMFRIAVYTRVFPAIFASCLQEDPGMEWNRLLLEGAIWKMLREQPRNLLPAKFASWHALLVDAVDDTIRQLNQGGIRVDHATWGRQNTASIRHPFSYTLPWFFRPWLDMPRDELPGDVDMPRVQTPDFGASERFVVSPGHEDQGIFEMPCGQCGHPLSPYYRAGHEAWVHGRPTPFLPGKTQHTLTLVPAPAAPRR